MKSINFDNPYLLLIALPLLFLILLPFFIAIRKENCTKSVVISTILHVLMVLLVALGVAGTNVQTVVTETQVYVVADVSYSANKNLDVVDDYIRGVEEAMPFNSKLGVVSFARDCKLTTPLGEEFDTVSGSDLDDSATNIAGALEYAGTLFDEGVIKRIVLITDGKQTDGQEKEAIIAAIENLYADDVKIDSIYLDSNLKAEQKEVQLMSVDFTESTYLGHEATADAHVYSSFDSSAILTLYKRVTTEAGSTDYEAEPAYTAFLARGDNIINLNLDTTEEGVYDYRLVVEAEGDVSAYNNEYAFTQTVAGKLKVLVVTASEADAKAVSLRYASRADVMAYVTNDTTTYSVEFKEDTAGERTAHIVAGRKVLVDAAVAQYTDVATVTREQKAVAIPTSVESLCVYDEIVLSSIDVRSLENKTAFIENLDTVVGQFGKSLITAGDLYLQNRDSATNDELSQEDTSILDKLEQMLPVNYGNDEHSPKLYGIVIDVSRSMETLWHFTMAKMAATQLVGLLGENDYVTVVAFSGEVQIAQQPVQVGKHRAEVIQLIQDLEVQQGTYLGAGLQKTLDFMNTMQFQKEQVMLITDGMTSTVENDDPSTVVKNMRSAGITVSVINTGSADAETLLKNLSIYGGGTYYYAETEEDITSVVLGEVADDVRETEILGQNHVYVQRFTDGVLDGVEALPDVYGFFNVNKEADATTVLTTKHQNTDGSWAESPLYAYRKYGNGMVSTFASKLSGTWIDGWDGEAGTKFFENVLTENTPREKSDYPYTLKTTEDGAQMLVEVMPYFTDPDATATVKLTMPNGDVVEQMLTFDSARYYYTFITEQVGRYTLEVVYERNGIQYAANKVLNLCYLPEYDEFAGYDASTLHQIVRHRGTVSEDGTVNLENDESEIESYTAYLTVYLMAAAIGLFVIDVIIRKLRWADIKSLFKRKKKTGGTRS